MTPDRDKKVGMMRFTFCDKVPKSSLLMIGAPPPDKTFGSIEELSKWLIDNNRAVLVENIEVIE